MRKFHSHTLENGLTVIGEYLPDALSCGLGMFVKTGSRDETASESGLSHFLEHMLFKGSKNLSALELSFALGGIGAQANAFTSEENTVYYMAVLPEYLERGSELLGEMMQSTLDPKEFALEKNVILEEIALYEDRPTFVLFESATSEYFGGHTAGSSVLGTHESVSALTAEGMHAYFARRYVANNMVFAVSGSFEWDAVVQYAERFFSNIPTAEAERVILPHTPEVKSKTITKADLNQGHICMVGAGPAANDPRRYDHNVFSCILGDASGSKFFWELVDSGLCDSAGFANEEMDAVGLSYAYASCPPERLAEVESKINGIFSFALEFSDKDLALAKTKLASRLVLQSESAMRRLMSVGLDWIYRGASSSVEEELASLKAVTADSIRETSATFLASPRTTIVLRP